MILRKLLIYSAILFFLLLSCSRKTPELILSCGWDQISMTDISKEVPLKVWSWTAEGSDGLPGFMRNKFLTTDDCKPINNGKQILVTSSGGGVALIEQESGNTLFYAAVPNAHSAELLPGDLLVAAASFSTKGNRLNLYSTNESNRVVFSDSLFGAHGLQWDGKRKVLWALGTEELRSYSLLKGESPELVLRNTIELPESDGHDLQFLDSKNELGLTTASGVWIYSIDTEKFSKHPLIGEENKVKSISYNSINGETAYVKAGDESWWAYYIRFAGSNRVVYLPGEKIYKVRWVY